MNIEEQNLNEPQNYIDTTNVKIKDKTTITYTPCYTKYGLLNKNIKYEYTRMD
jgi:hypothetical protein